MTGPPIATARGSAYVTSAPAKRQPWAVTSAWSTSPGSSSTRLATLGRWPPAATWLARSTAAHHALALSSRLDVASMARLLRPNLAVRTGGDETRQRAGWEETAKAGAGTKKG